MSNDGTSPAVVWFRQDLRLADHAALEAAMAEGRPVVPIYILDNESAGPWAWGGASRWWLHHSLLSLQAALQQRGAPLILRRGNPAAILPALLHETGASEIHAGAMHEPWARKVDAALAKALPEGALHLHRTATLFDHDSIRTKTGGIYGIYTPFARAARARGEPAPLIPAPDHIPTPKSHPRSETLDGWNLLPTAPDWSAGLRETWTPGEPGAHERLKTFADHHAAKYDIGRNLPGQPGTSMLSPHLHWGEISPNQVWHAIAAKPHNAGTDTYLAEILWREFAAYLLWHNPHMPEHPLRPRFAALPARRSEAESAAWNRGQTGIPIVDAGMRQLWQIGWMHNRVRMIVASYLVKHMLMPFQTGETWFWDTLVDADLASNAAGWQWVAGCGIDSQPFFRIFNPVSQGEKFDPDGAYVRRYVPELAKLPGKFLHAPWTAPPEILKAAGITLGATYPRPIVDLAEGRQRALDAYRDTVKEDSPPEVGSKETGPKEAGARKAEAA